MRRRAARRTVAVFLATLLTVAIHLPMHAGAAEEPAADFTVATTGSDTNPGTAQQPFATLARAKQAVRERLAAGIDADLTVLVREGTYELAEPLVFEPADSSTAEHAVIYAAYPGETVVLSGGRRLAGFEQGDGGLWTVRVPGADDGPTPRNLFVGERRAVRARTPNADAEPNCVQLKAVEFAPDRAHFAATLPTGVLGDWQHPDHRVEAMIAGNWAINRKRVASIDAAKSTVVLAPPHRHGPGYIFPSTGRWCYFENAPELLDQPGEWYLDRKSGQLSYRPLPDADPGGVKAVLPRLTRLVEIRGTAEQPVRNVRFRGLRLMHTDWQLPPDGYMGIQACHYGSNPQPGLRWQRIPAAVSMRYAEGCRVEGGVLAHLGGTGVELADGCRDCTVRGNHVFDVSANGIMVGGPNVEEQVPRGNRVANNHVHAGGVEYYGAIGIWVGFAQGTAVTHNLVHDLPYTGISVGWQWNPEPTVCRENLIEWNHVHNVMNRLCDGGCIYTLGFQPGTVIRGNHLHDVNRSPMAQGAPNNGMFIDQGSKGYLFQENVIYDTSAQPVRFNQCQHDWHTWKDNHIGAEAEVTVSGKEIIARAGLEPAYQDQDQEHLH